ncbi:MAG: hypothetical protein ACRC2T_18445, partial [Thermoguttaceae bacterium]
LTPEITASFLNGSVVRENGIVKQAEVNGIIEIQGSFYTTYTITGSDLIPAFSREYLYKKLQAEAQKVLPE